MFLSIDPGIANCGIAVVDHTTEYRVLETHLVKNARKFTEEEKVIELIYGARAVKILAIKAKIEELLEKYPEVNLVVVEAPFYNALTPMAYGSLLEVIMCLKYSVILPRGLLFKLIEPLLVKKLFTNKGMASKEAMKEFLKIKKDDKSVILDAEVDTLSEHEIDAVAVGFVHYLTTKEPPTQ